MLFYLFITIVSTFTVYLYQRLASAAVEGKSSRLPRGLLLFTSFMTVFLVSALRVDVGTDYKSYLSWFSNAEYNKNTYFEPGFNLMAKGTAYFTNDPQWIFIISSFATVFLVYAAIRKYSVNPALSVLLFTAMGFLFFSFNATRQFVAIGIMLYAFGYLLNRQWVKYLIAIMLASLFHKTVFLMAGIYALANHRYSKLSYLVIAIVSFASIIFRESLLDLLLTFYPSFKDNTEYLYRVKFSEIFISSSVILLFVLRRYLKNGVMSLDKQKDRIIVNLVFFTFIIHTGFAWLPYTGRISLYLDILLILIVPLLLSYIKDRGWKYFFIAMTVIFYSVYLFISAGLNDSHDVLPYISIFNRGSFYP